MHAPAYCSQRALRAVVKSVLRWYYELEDGILGYEEHLLFDARFLNYRVDVWHLLAQLTDEERLVLQLIHRDGVPQAAAVRLAHIRTDRPDTFVAALESRLGRRLIRASLDDLSCYLSTRHPEVFY